MLTRSDWRAALAATATAVLALVAVVAGPSAPAGAAAPDRIDAFGGAVDAGSPEASATNRLVGVAPHPDGGYWVARSDGAVFSFAGAPFYGSLGGQRLRAPVVGMAARPDGTGYWLVAADGGVFAFGAAPFAGSMGGVSMASPIVGMTSTMSGNGYWLASAEGGVFSFGTAHYWGSMGGIPLNQPVVGIAASGRGGYWLVASDGGIFNFGGAPFPGSAGALPLRAPVVGMAGTASGRGYWLASSDGGVFTYGDAPFLGTGASTGDPVTSVSAAGRSGAYRLLHSPSAPVVTFPAFTAPPLPAGSGTGRRVVYSNPAQRVWLVGGDGRVEYSYAVSGRRGVPAGGTYSVYSKSRSTSAGHDGITMQNMVRFAHGRDLPIGFHAIPRFPSGRPLQSEDDLGGYRSAGCVRQADADAARLWDWAPIGTKVVVVY